MTDDDIDLLAVSRGSVTAPAGCGKTFRIVEALARHSGPKPILVLTHTNAGVAALRARLSSESVAPSAYRLATIDGWAMRLVSTFPATSAVEPAVLRLADRSADYPKIRRAAAQLLADGNMQDLVGATYARLLVDEYQDCSTFQHSLVKNAAQAVPTCILGDQMQAIFGFGPDTLPDWDREVCGLFPVAGKLDTPWRWINAGTEGLGRWLLEVRERLRDGEDIDLSAAPSEVRWVELDGTDDYRRRHRAALERPPNGRGCVFVVGDSRNPESQRQFASQTPGAVTVEAVDLRDFVDFAERFDVSSPDALVHLLEFGQRVMTNVGTAHLLRRLESLRGGRSRTAATTAEDAALALQRAPSHEYAASLLVALSGQPEVRVHRPIVLKACTAALRASGAGGGTFADHAIRERERFRMAGRRLPARAVGSTLLLKGLEAEVVVILDASRLDSRNLYVAMTRGSRVLVVCSSTHILSPGRVA